MLRAVRASVRAVALIAIVVALGPLALGTRALAELERLRGVPPERARSQALAARVQAWWARASLRVAGVRVRLSGAEWLARGAQLVCANHRGYLDVLVLAAVLPGRFVAMHEIRGWWGLGWMARSTGTLFLRRERPRELPQANAEVARTLAAGVPVLLFPEGRAGPGDRLAPLRSPLFREAAARGLPCVPVALGYATPGEPWSTAWTVAWWGEMGLFRHLGRLLGLARIEASVVVAGPPLVGRDRKALAAAVAERLDAAVEPVALVPAPPDNPWRAQEPGGLRSARPAGR